MAVFRKRILAVAVKIETTEGTDSTPTLATDAIRLVNLPMLKAAYLEDGKKNRAQHGGLGYLARNTPNGRWASIDLVLEARGKGTSAYASSSDYVEADALLRMAGFAKSYAAAAMSYTTLDAGMETGTLKMWGADGNLYTMVGCIAKGPKLLFSPGQTVTMSFTVVGRLTADPAAASISGLTLNPVFAPIWAGTNLDLGNGPLWSTSTAAPGQLVPRKFSIDVNTSEGARPWAGAAGLLGHYISERTVRASLDVEAVPLSVYNPYANALTMPSPNPLTTSANTGAGNTFTVLTGNFQQELPTEIDLQGIVGWTLAGDIAARSIPNGPGLGRELLIQYS